ncbi:MAG: transglycosylase SLT domain-containing protein [Actinomycetota bacterium]
MEGPQATGRSLAAAEAGIRSDETSPERAAEFARVQQAAYRTLVANPQWRPEALAQLPEELIAAAEANITAGAELRALTRPQPQLPPWRIIEPPPAEELLGYYRQAETEFGVRWEYLAAIHLVETRMGRIRGTSTAGAQGPMQFIPPTWAAYGEGDINDPLDSIRAAGRYLKASGAPGNMDRALHAYNPTPRYVKAISIYADQMMQDERTYLGYYHWQVFYRTIDGDVELPVGYGS